jgi:hypothetical protein
MVLGSVREPGRWSGVPLFEAELNDRWWPLGNMDGDFIVVHLGTERVFWGEKDVPPVRLEANDIASFLATYRDRLASGKFTLEEGADSQHERPCPRPRHR